MFSINFAPFYVGEIHFLNSSECWRNVDQVQFVMVKILIYSLSHMWYFFQTFPSRLLVL